MKLKYIYRKNSAIEKNILRIEVAKKVLDLFPPFPHIEESLRHKSLLKSSLFSAKIEGNRLKLEEVQNLNLNSENIERKEVLNILRALKWIYSDKVNKKITAKTLLKLHLLIMDSISDCGKFRKEPSAIFNQAGVAIYITPPPSEIENLIDQLLRFINKKDDHIVIKAAIAHFAFEKIHPFLDGNGRVGRLLSTLILKNFSYGFRGLNSLEEYLSENREEYYDLLNVPAKDITSFVVFFTQAVAASCEKTTEFLKNRKEEKAEDLLLPRRQEILSIIKDHEMVSFDLIKRRFFKVPASSLHYDLKFLLNKGFIKKLGSTRGVLYSVKTSDF